MGKIINKVVKVPRGDPEFFFNKLRQLMYPDKKTVKFMISHKISFEFIYGEWKHLIQESDFVPIIEFAEFSMEWAHIINFGKIGENRYHFSKSEIIYWIQFEDEEDVEFVTEKEDC